MCLSYTARIYHYLEKLKIHIMKRNDYLQHYVITDVMHMGAGYVWKI